MVAAPGLDLLGLHSHIGSQIFDTSGFEVAARRVLALHAQVGAELGVTMPELDLGGGFGIAYTTQDDPSDPAQLAIEMSKIVEHECRALGIERAAAVDRARPRDRRPGDVHRLHGRHGQAGRARRGSGAHLRQRRRRHERQHPHRPLRRRLLLHARLARRRPRRRRWRGSSASTARPATSWSRTSSCPADVRPGDLLAVPSTGAYCRSMASNYNHALRPPVVAVRDGVATTIVRRETVDDLLATDLGATPDEAAERRRAGLRRRSARRWCGCSPSRPVTWPRGSAHRCELVGVAVRRIDAPRDVDVPDGLLTTDAAALVARDDVDVVVEVIGGIEPARSLILAALENGASVVTANKALLAEDGPTLFEAAEKAGRDLYYEAAVAGAIPILRPLRESLAGDRVTRVLGIVNGTTNFILDKMDSTGAGFEEALEEAQDLGYAEADPTADVEGFDAAAKAAILASLAFHSRVTAADVHREGITDVTAADIAVGRARWAAWSSCSRSPSWSDADGARGRLGPRAPGDDPEVAPAGQRARGVQRGVRRVRRGRPADVLRPGRRRGADRERGARRPGHRGPQPARRDPRRRRVGVRRPGRAADGGDPHALPHRHRRRRPRRRARGDRHRLRRGGRLDPDRCARRAAAPTPSSSWSPTTRPTRSSRAPSSACAGWPACAR